MRWRPVIILGLLGFALAAAASPVLAAGCPERPRCHGCGCKGGPGYRAPDGHCVGFRELEEVCGNPPTRRCVFENAPGTGANRECALGPDAAAAPTSKKRTTDD